jgi:hypothetical protein
LSVIEKEGSVRLIENCRLFVSQDRQFMAETRQFAAAHHSRRYRRARRTHLVPYNDSIHKAHRVGRQLETLGMRIVHHFLPPHSPNDNVIEPLWTQLHVHVARDHQHPTIESLVEAVNPFLDNAQPFSGIQISTLRSAP